MKNVLYVATIMTGLICLVPTMAQVKQAKKEPPKDFVLYDTAPDAVNQV